MQTKDKNMQIHEKKDVKQNYMYAILSVLSQKRRKKSTCPDPEELAAFSEGRLSSRQRKKIIAHFNDCAACRRNWLMLESVLEETAPAKERGTALLFQKLKSIGRLPAFAGGGLGLALAACLLLVFFYPSQNALQQMVSDSFGRLSPAEIAIYNSLASRGGDEYEDDQVSDALFAFKAGIAAGKAMLVVESGEFSAHKFEDELHTILYTMGQWAVLMQCACISKEPVSMEFWSEQEAIADKMHQALRNADNTDVDAQSVSQIADLIAAAIARVNETGGKVDACDDITLAFKALEHQLR